MIEALFNHWPEYVIEGALLGIYMIAACVVTFVLRHPASPMSSVVRSPLLARVITGIAMGLTGIAIIYSPLGQRSGSHLNPATTLTYYWLGKVRAWDAVFYVVAQFVGGVIGVALSGLLLRSAIRHRAVNYAVTAPGTRGSLAAWMGESALAFIMMTMVLNSTNNASTAAYTGVFSGALLAIFITVEAPLSGMSLNPARTLGSALPARSFRGLWVYFTAPPLAMLGAAALYVGIHEGDRVFCAKLNHEGHARCIFNCRINEMPGRVSHPAGGGGITDRGN